MPISFNYISQQQTYGSSFLDNFYNIFTSFRHISEIYFQSLNCWKVYLQYTGMEF